VRRLDPALPPSEKVAIENNCPDANYLFIGTPAQVAGWYFPNTGHPHMSSHLQLLVSAPITSRSNIFRLKALFSEQRARESSEPRSRNDWEELAIEWHTMANLAARAKGESVKTDVA
jgi:hypothetical protein